MSEQIYIVEFEGISTKEANLYAEELGKLLSQASEDIKVERRQAEPGSQDFGATLLLILGTPAAALFLGKLGNWLIKRQSAKVTIKKGDGEIVVENISGKDAASLTDKYLKKF